MLSETVGTGGYDAIWKIDDYREINWIPGQEPRKRSVSGKICLGIFRWHVIITFEGSLHMDRMVRAAKQQRGQDLINLCLCIDFSCLRLMDDTVTELLIKGENYDTPPIYDNDIKAPAHALPLKSNPDSKSEYSRIHTDLRYCLREDPYHVRFPTLDFGEHIPMESVTSIKKIRPLSPHVHEVSLIGNDKRIVFKEIGGPLHLPEDSQALYQELQNLLFLKGIKSIVQLIAAVVSLNPYQTWQCERSCAGTETRGALVLRGILLEYHPKGTLEHALHSAAKPISQTTSQWQKWALQITQALDCLHKCGITHMDLKPSNVVIDVDSNAVLIDVSGIGGTTHEWLAPEMFHSSNPLEEDVESKKKNDIWALGKLISCMANACGRLEKAKLDAIASAASTKDPSSRTSLEHLAFQLSGAVTTVCAST